MDNIIEIIVFFFVIYSILGSLFGKKKKQQKAGPSEKPLPDIPRQTRRVPQTRSPQRPSSQDILEELFGLKIPKPEENDQYSQPEYQENLEYQSWDPEKDFKKKVEEKEKYEYRNIEKEYADVNYDKISTLEKTKKKPKPVTIKKETLPTVSLNKRTVEIRQKLRDPQSIRDLFIISEIINKPRALRKIK